MSYSLVLSRRALLVASLFVPVLLLGGCAATDHVYLTWKDDPRTTMTVNFQSPTYYDDLKLAYDTVSREGDVASYRFTAEGATTRQIPGLRDERPITSCWPRTARA
jgi:hypothetical protein